MMRVSCFYLSIAFPQILTVVCKMDILGILPGIRSEISPFAVTPPWYEQSFLGNAVPVWGLSQEGGLDLCWSLTDAPHLLKESSSAQGELAGSWTLLFTVCPKSLLTSANSSIYY